MLSYVIQFFLTKINASINHELSWFSCLSWKVKAVKSRTRERFYYIYFIFPSNELIQSFKIHVARTFCDKLIDQTVKWWLIQLDETNAGRVLYMIQNNMRQHLYIRIYIYIYVHGSLRELRREVDKNCALSQLIKYRKKKTADKRVISSVKLTRRAFTYWTNAI